MQYKKPGGLHDTRNLPVTGLDHIEQITNIYTFRFSFTNVRTVTTPQRNLMYSNQGIFPLQVCSVIFVQFRFGLNSAAPS